MWVRESEKVRDKLRKTEELSKRERERRMDPPCSGMSLLGFLTDPRHKTNREVFAGSLTSSNLYSGNTPHQKICVPIQRFIEENHNSIMWSADIWLFSMLVWIS